MVIDRYLQAWGVQNEYLDLPQLTEEKLHSAAAAGKPCDLLLVAGRPDDGESREWITELRKHPLFAALKIVLVSAHSSPNQADSTALAGVDGYFAASGETTEAA